MTGADIPGTDQERAQAILVFAGLVGGGVIAYFAASAVRDGDLLATEPFPEGGDAVGVVGYAGGLAFTGISMKALVDEVGWAPVLWGGAGITAAALLVRAIRG